jgi:hypothetical protein
LTEVEKAGGPPEMKLSGENQERTHLVIFIPFSYHSDEIMSLEE